MNKVFTLLLFSFSLPFYSCSDEVSPVTTPVIPIDDSWSVPIDEVFDGGPGLDGIPSIDNPQFSSIEDVDFLNDDDLVLLIEDGEEVKAYPHPVLDWHEIVNDEVGVNKLAITYCPLTGTGVAWNRVIDGEETTFGVSGLLYNSNLMPYDRKTRSTWSQQRLDCVNGELQGMSAENFSLVELDFKTLKRAYPDAKIMNTNTGFNRNYGTYPYNDYRTNNSRLLFPLSTEDDRLPNKERALGIVNAIGEDRVYAFDDGNDEFNTINDQLNGQDILVIRSLQNNFIVAFNNDRDLQLVSDKFPIILSDENGIQYDILGRADQLSPNLEMPTQFIGYWFSWGAFYPNIDLVE